MTAHTRSRSASARRRRALAVVLAAGTLAAGCGGKTNPLEIGFRRVALDLAFKDAEKAPPIEAAQVREVVSHQFVDYTDYEFEEPESPRVRRVPPAPKVPTRECPTAPEGATPDRVAFAVVKDPPKVGTYPRHNEGSLSIELATTGFDLPVPPLSKWDIPSVSFVHATTAASDSDVDALNPPPEVRANETAFPEIPQFQITKRLLTGYSTTDTYRYTYDGGDDDYLYLVKRETVARGQTTVFEPTPPVRLVKLNETEGDIVNAGVVHAGVDRKTNMALAVQSQILSREFVDVCGEMADTYRVQIKEQFVDLSKTPPQTSGNEGDTTNFLNIQFDNGLLIVREEVHSTLRTTTTVLGQQVPLVVRYNYTSTLDKLSPDPLAPPTSAPLAPAPTNDGAEESE